MTSKGCYDIKRVVITSKEVLLHQRDVMPSKGCYDIKRGVMTSKRVL